MGETSASVNGARPVKENRFTRLLPPGGTASTPGGDPTIDLRAADPAKSSVAGGTPLPARSEYSFLGPPRDSDELGWLAHYRVRRLIGSGGMGLVFLAEDTQLLRPVAVKVIRPELASSPEAAARFVREARPAAAIEHDHIVTIYQVGEDRGVPFIAMQFSRASRSTTGSSARPRCRSPRSCGSAARSPRGLAAAHDAAWSTATSSPPTSGSKAPQRPGQDPRLRPGAAGRDDVAA